MFFCIFHDYEIISQIKNKSIAELVIESGKESFKANGAGITKGSLITTLKCKKCNKVKIIKTDY